MKKEKTISVVELIKYVILKWRLLLIGMVVFAILMGGYAAAKAYMTGNDVKKQQESANYEQYESSLTEDEIREVKDAENNYLTYENIYKDYQNYMSNSIRMQLDANSVPTKKLIYQISGHDEARNIADTYGDIFPDNDVCKRIVQETTLDVDVAYIKELIDVTNSHMDIITIDGQQISNILEENEENSNSVLMLITVISDNKANCESIGNIIETELNNTTEELQERFGNFVIQKVGDYYCEEINNELLSDQHERISEMNNVNAIMNNLKSSLTEPQQSYLSALLASDQEVGSNSQEEIVQIQYINLKYIVVGAILGVLIVGFCLVCQFLVNRHLISNCFIEIDLKSSLLGTFTEIKKKKKIGNRFDRWLKSLFEQNNESFSEDEKLQMLAANIRVLMQKKGLKEIYITGTVKTNETIEFLKKLQKVLKDNEVDFLMGQSILYDAISMEKFAAADGAIFVEQRGKSLMKEMVEETECSNNYGVHILGFIVVE